MASTLETFGGTRQLNYCTLPTIDVEILPDVHHCKTCGTAITYQPRGGSVWVHNSLVPDHGFITPKTRCRYCHSEDATYHQHAWFDAVECDRCGGVTGYAIGD